jgi:hypothetical protein
VRTRGEPGKLGVQEQTKLEASARERRRFTTLKEFSEFVKVTPPGADPRTLYKPSDFDFQLRPGSAAVDAGVRSIGINDDFTGRAPDLGAYESGRPAPYSVPDRSGGSSHPPNAVSLLLPSELY